MPKQLTEASIKAMSPKQLLKCLKRLQELEEKHSKQHKSIFEFVVSSSESSSDSEAETETEDDYNNKMLSNNKNAIHHKKKQK